MADPQLPGIVRVLAVQQSVSGIPRDDVVNSWAFRNENYDPAIQFGTTPPQRAQLADHLQTFYRAISYLASTAVMTNKLTLRGYDLGQPPGKRSGNTWIEDPREPWIEERTLTRAGSGQQIPEEACVVISLQGLRNLPRQRGRLFIGPFGAIATATDSGRVTVLPALRTQLATAVRVLRNAALADGWTLGIVSQVDEAFVPVLTGWIDDAWDTQKRRGPDPQSRALIDFTQAP